jgi:hypothetical protein
MNTFVDVSGNIFVTVIVSVYWQWETKFTNWLNLLEIFERSCLAFVVSFQLIMSITLL